VVPCCLLIVVSYSSANFFMCSIPSSRALFFAVVDEDGNIFALNFTAWFSIAFDAASRVLLARLPNSSGSIPRNSSLSTTYKYVNIGRLEMRVMV